MRRRASFEYRHAMRKLRHSLPVLLSLLAGLSPGALLAVDYEPPRTFDPSTLPADKAQGPHFKVLAPIENDGFMNTFHVSSDFGAFDAEGRAFLEIRLRELAALAELAELSKTAVFADAVKEGLKTATVGQVETVAAIAQDPVGTVKGVPGGVTRLFNRTKAQAQDAYASVKESEAEKKGGGSSTSTQDKAADASSAYAKRYLGVTRSQRLWAQKLGVDPYSSNAVLQKEIASVAKIDAVGRFSVRFAGLPSIPGISYARKTNELVWGTDPYDLKLMNEKKLAALGAAPDAVRVFMSNPFLSPTRQTYVVQALDSLAGVADRGKLIAQGAGVDSETAGYFFALSVQMLSWRHQHGSPLVRILDGRAAPLALTADGTVVGMAATDSVSWTAALSGALDRLRDGTSGVGKAYEIGFLGDVSPTARGAMQARGIAVRDNLARELETSATKP
jgi:hypothetical protein